MSSRRESNYISDKDCQFKNVKKLEQFQLFSQFLGFFMYFKLHLISNDFIFCFSVIRKILKLVSVKSCQ